MTIGPGPNATSGIKYYIGTTAADPLLDTYVQVGSLNNIPAYGPNTQDITFEDLSQGTILHFNGAQDDGTLAIEVGMDLSDDGQLAIIDAQSVTNRKFNYNHKIVYNDSQPATSSSVTITVASPGVVTWTGHGLKPNTAVQFSTTGTLPTGLTAGTTYFVKTVLDANTFTLSATKGGTAINTTGAPGTGHTGTTVPSATTDFFKARVGSYQRNPGNLQSVAKALVNLRLLSGSIVLQARLP
jgi:hypothetical protein